MKEISAEIVAQKWTEVNKMEKDFSIHIKQINSKSDDYMEEILENIMEMVDHYYCVQDQYHTWIDAVIDTDTFDVDEEINLLSRHYPTYAFKVTTFDNEIEQDRTTYTFNGKSVQFTPVVKSAEEVAQEMFPTINTIFDSDNYIEVETIFH